jgi:hypothetical protein
MTKKRTTKPKPVMIATLQDLVNTVTPENMKLLYEDLGIWLVSMTAMKAAGMELGEVAMEWTDDGKNEITGMHITMTHPKS